MFSAPAAVEWFSEASPMLASTIASAGQRGGGPQPGGPAQRERQPDRPRQVRGDGRGLRDDVQVGVAEDLVPAAGDRLGRRRGQAEQHVAARRPWAAAACGRADQVEGARTGSAAGPGRPGRRAAASAALPSWPGGADGVEAGVAVPQPAGGQVQVAAGQLGVEQVQARAAGQRGAGPDRAAPVAGQRAIRGGCPQLQHAVGEVLLGHVAADPGGLVSIATETALWRQMDAPP